MPGRREYFSCICPYCLVIRWLATGVTLNVHHQLWTFSNMCVHILGHLLLPQIGCEAFSYCEMRSAISSHELDGYSWSGAQTTQDG